jgi:ABC-2 type transport system permease protein
MKDSKIGLIVAREYSTRVKRKSFLVLTFLVPLLLIALITVPLALSLIKGNDVKRIAVTDTEGRYLHRLHDNAYYRFIPASSVPTNPKNRLNSGKDQAYLVLKGNLIADTSSATLYAEKQVDMDLKSFIGNQLDSLAQADKIASYRIPGLDSILKEARAKVHLTTIKWSKEGEEKKSSSEIALMVGMIATTIIYIFIFAYGAMVMNGVIEEKTNRIVEVIVSSVRPFQLMMGKIIGIALVGLTQVLLWLVLLGGVLGIAVNALKDQPRSKQVEQLGSQVMQNTNLPGEKSAFDATGSDFTGDKLQDGLEMLSNLNVGEIVLWFILYFLAGYLLYASLFAAIGSAIDNQEEAQQFTLPLTMMVLFALYAGIYGAQNPEGPLAFWCSLIPFTSPIVMMVRLPFGVPLWQLLLSYSLLILTFVGTTGVAAKIYRTGILMYGKKASYKELWKWLTYKN